VDLVEKKARHHKKRAKDAERTAVTSEGRKPPRGSTGRIFRLSRHRLQRLQHRSRGAGTRRHIPDRDEEPQGEGRGEWRRAAPQRSPSREGFHQADVEPDLQPEGLPVEDDLEAMGREASPLLRQCLCRSPQACEGHRRHQPGLPQQIPRKTATSFESRGYSVDWEVPEPTCFVGGPT
jgi:hypothetical protein